MSDTDTEKEEYAISSQALAVLLESTDLAFKRGCFTAAEAAPISNAYLVVKKALQDANKNNNTGDI